MKRLKQSRKKVAALIAITLVPLIYAGLLTWANQDPAHNLDNVPAAVVNEDESVQVNGKQVSLGESLSKELASSTRKNNFKWQQMSASAAEAALESGDVLAVMTIPAEFSESAVSSAENNADTAKTATFQVETNDASNMIAGTIASTIAVNVRDSLATQVSSEYMKNMYLGFTSVHDNMAEASGGAAQLATGAGDAENGAATLVTGLDNLANGVGLLTSGAGAVASGAASANGGAQSLSEGLSTLRSQTAQLPDQTTQLATGAETAAEGSSTLASSLGQLNQGAQSLSSGAQNALVGARDLSTGLDALSAEAPALSEGAGRVSEGLTILLASYDSLNDAQRKAALADLSNGATKVSLGTQKVQISATKLAAGAQHLVGSEEQQTGLTALAGGTTHLAQGSADATSGAERLKLGTAQVASGTSMLSAKMPELTTAISQASIGSATLAGGTSQVSSGATALARNLGSVESGAAQATSGARALHEGIISLGSGASHLNAGLAQGVDQVPSFTNQEASALSEITAEPVRADVQRKYEVPAYGYALAPYFTALALWVGAIGYFLMMPALSRRALASRGSGALVALRSFTTVGLVAVAQSALVTFILTSALGLNVANAWGLFGMITLASLTFMALNQALIALFGDPGRFLALILIVLQLAAAGGTYPIETSPAFFQSIHPLFPLTYAVESFRSLIAGGTLGQAQSVLVMTAWLVAALLATILAASRARRKHRALALDI